MQSTLKFLFLVFFHQEHSVKFFFVYVRVCVCVCVSVLNKSEQWFMVIWNWPVSCASTMLRMPLAAAATKTDCWSQELIKGLKQWRGEHFPTGTKRHVRKSWKVVEFLISRSMKKDCELLSALNHNHMVDISWYHEDAVLKSNHSDLQMKVKVCLREFLRQSRAPALPGNKIRRSTIFKGKKQTLQWGENPESRESSKPTFLRRIQSFSSRWQRGKWPTQHHATKHGFHRSSDLSTNITHNPVPRDGLAKTAASHVLDHEARHRISGYKSLGGNHQSPRGRGRSCRSAVKEDWDDLRPLSSRPFQLEIHGICIYTCAH